MEVVGSFSETSSETEIILEAVPVDDGSLDLVSIRQLTGKKVWENEARNVADGAADSDGAPGAPRKLGRVLAFLFHPSENRCIGFLAKRPDVALMFRRKDLFVSFGGFDVIQGRIIAGKAAGDKGKTAEKAARAAGASLDECIVWQGLPVVCEDGTVLGVASDVLCELGTGSVYELEVGNGAAANALLGTLHVPADEIVGFCICQEVADPETPAAAASSTAASAASEGAAASVPNVGAAPLVSSFPAIMVKNAAKMRPIEGGAAEKAGSATAVVAHNAKQAIDKIKPKAKEATAAAGDAVNKGAYVTGRQIGRTKGMFSAFKEEFDKALHDDGENAS